MKSLRPFIKSPSVHEYRDSFAKKVPIESDGKNLQYLNSSSCVLIIKNEVVSLNNSSTNSKKNNYSCFFIKK